MTEFVILGTSHDFQESADFLQHVRQTIEKHEITFVAEENPLNLPKLRDETERLSIQYLQVDLSPSEIKDYGIGREMDLRLEHFAQEDVRFSNADGIRETVWLQKINRAMSGGRVLVVCGYLHVKYLADRVQGEGCVLVDMGTFRASCSVETRRAS